MAPKKKEPKHPKDMTTEEAVKHLFHADVIEHAKKKAAEPKKPRNG
ncbi:MAG TPA: hypothetical protein VMF91_22735 [Bryobacteraceae bacterium]|nr:hypothetical protein [Bryobacteraceae bacterium]